MAHEINATSLIVLSMSAAIIERNDIKLDEKIFKFYLIYILSSLNPKLLL